jgi:hypothetical protein
VAHAGDEAFAAAFQQFQHAGSGDEAAIERAAAQFAELSQSAPADPVLLAYAGAAHAQQARTTVLPWRKIAFAEDGLAQIDKALTLLEPAHDRPLHRGTPASLETPFVAANTFLRLPAMFNRQARGAKLLDEVLASPLLAAAPLPFRGAVWMRAADLARQQERRADARRWLEQVVSEDAPQAAQARAKLKELS